MGRVPFWRFPSSPTSLFYHLPVHCDHDRLGATFPIMLQKPFRPPLLQKSAQQETSTQDDFPQPPAKRQRVSSDQKVDSYTQQPERTSSLDGSIPPQSQPRKPLLTINDNHAVRKSTSDDKSKPEAYYNVLWCVAALFSL